jgi:AcrR family transcriptional regulator
MDVKNRKEQQAQATRGALVSVARELFGSRGWADTPIEEVVARTGMTKGALYHHFRDKKDLFQEVFVQVERELTDQVNAAGTGAADPFRRLSAACHAYLDACMSPEVQRIAVLDAPSVLTWSKYCEIDEEFAIKALMARLEALRQAGYQFGEPVDSLAHLLIGTLTMGARVIARATDRDVARQQVGATLDRVLEGLVGLPTA